MTKIKYKEAEAPGWFYSFDENGNKSQSWHPRNKPVMEKERLAWLAAGNEMEPRFTLEEQATKEAEEIESAKVAYKGLRKSAYNAAGLTFDYWNELVIEENTAGQTAYRADRDVIRAEIPKPV